MLEKLPLVSVIIPCWNEENFIGRCLDSLIKQDFPKENLEVLVIDGMSEDKTREIIKNYARQCSFIRLLENPKKFTPFGLNIGIKNSKGEIIVRADAHAEYNEDYISKSIKYLEEYGVDNVGGVIETPLAERATKKARAIALSLSHPFGSASSFRIGIKKPCLVDTAFGGCYRREVFNKVGFFNENLIRSQDLEFNLRLKRAGGKILLAPDITFRYYPKSSFWEFFQHNFVDGIWAIYPLKFTKTPFRMRHYLPLFFILGLFSFLVLSLISRPFLSLFTILIFLYFVMNILFSISIATKEKKLEYLILMPIAFICRHFGYGLGSVWGLIKISADKVKIKKA